LDGTRRFFGSALGLEPVIADSLADRLLQAALGLLETAFHLIPIHDVSFDLKRFVTAA